MNPPTARSGGARWGSLVPEGPAAYARALFSVWRPQGRFVLFAQGRTGSELLRSLLSAHPEVRCEGEILARRRLLPMAFLEGRAARRGPSVYGFKVKVYHLTDVQGMRDPAAFLRRLHARHWRIVYLYRRNLLRQAVSNVVAEKRRAFHRRTGEGAAFGKVHIDCGRLLASMANRRRFLAVEREVLGDLPRVDVVYEDDLLPPERHQQAADRVFAFLGLDSARTHSDHLRVTPDRLVDFVENYDEVTAAVGASEFAEYLAE